MHEKNIAQKKNLRKKNCKQNSSAKKNSAQTKNLRKIVHKKIMNKLVHRIHPRKNILHKKIR